jgi:P4 family phage/plasmid primase-like protien
VKDTMQQDLEVARNLARNGVPIFLASPGGEAKGYQLPRGWQNTVADPSVLDNWKPGMAVCAVMGHTFDAVDIDADKGGEVPPAVMPVSYGRTRTPSGGTHDFVAPLGVRSKDGVFQGVDVKAGSGDRGRGFVFIPPTTGKNGAKYSWEQAPTHFNTHGDNSGKELAGYVKSSQATPGAPLSYSGPPYEELSDHHKRLSRNHTDKFFEDWRIVLDDATTWPEGKRDSKGRGWELLTRDFAWATASLAAAPWSSLTEQEAQDRYCDTLPEAIAKDPKCRGKWYDGLLEKAGAAPVKLPPWLEFSVIDPYVAGKLNLPEEFGDDQIVKWISESGASRHMIYNSSRGWLKWDGKKWNDCTDVSAIDEVRRILGGMRARMIVAGMRSDKQIVKVLNNLSSEWKIRAITRLLRGVVEVSNDMFEEDPDLLNCDNGVVNLRTGELLDHDRSYYMTRITEAKYLPGSRFNNPLFDRMIQAVNPEVRDWFQERLGQAATGYTPDDDSVLFLIGPGANGKSTWMTAAKHALGEYAEFVSDRVLFPTKGAHPTERTTLQNLRLAILEEISESTYLNSMALKQTVGVSKMSARKIAKDEISWTPTHSLMIATNYTPRVPENDTGTWRRMHKMEWNEPIVPDRTVRSRVDLGEVNEAMLDWIVEGSKRWYAAGKLLPDLPAKIERANQEWKESSDPLYGFVEDELVLDPTSHILSMELFNAANDYVMSRGYSKMALSTLAQRLKRHPLLENNGVESKRRSTANIKDHIDTRYGTQVRNIATTWSGLRWNPEIKDFG